MGELTQRRGGREGRYEDGEQMDKKWGREVAGKVVLSQQILLLGPFVTDFVVGICR